MTREIVLDTETTGFNPSAGHRIVEIACVELIDGHRTGNVFHTYLNPERDVPADAVAVHGLTNEFLADKPLFAQKAQELLDFIGNDTLVIHNANFDMKFINAELGQCGYPSIPKERVIDTMEMGKRKLPGVRLKLDTLCEHFGIDSSKRTQHGALLDAELLADVYVKLKELEDQRIEHAERSSRPKKTASGGRGH